MKRLILSLLLCLAFVSGCSQIAKDKSPRVVTDTFKVDSLFYSPDMVTMYGAARSVNVHLTLTGGAPSYASFCTPEFCMEIAVGKLLNIVAVNKQQARAIYEGVDVETRQKVLFGITRTSDIGKIVSFGVLHQSKLLTFKVVNYKIRLADVRVPRRTETHSDLSSGTF